MVCLAADGARPSRILDVEPLSAVMSSGGALMAIFKSLPTTKKLSAWLSSPGRVHRGWVDQQGIHPTRGATVVHGDPTRPVEWRSFSPDFRRRLSGSAANLEEGKKAAMDALHELTGRRWD